MHKDWYGPVYSHGNIQKPAPCWSQTSHQPQDRSTIYKIGYVNLTISVQILQHVFPIVHSVIQNLEKIDKDEQC